jgi:hypothetical protein
MSLAEDDIGYLPEYVPDNSISGGIHQSLIHLIVLPIFLAITFTE